jgi:hypothetical protein
LSLHRLYDEYEYDDFGADHYDVHDHDHFVDDDHDAGRSHDYDANRPDDYDHVLGDYDDALRCVSVRQRARSASVLRSVSGR